MIANGAMFFMITINLHKESFCFRPSSLCLAPARNLLSGLESSSTDSSSYALNSNALGITQLDVASTTPKPTTLELVRLKIEFRAAPDSTTVANPTTEGNLFGRQRC